MVRFTLLATAGLASSALGASLPPPTGKYSVGLKKYAIPHINPNDTSWPGGTSTSFLATIFYPTLEKPSKKKRPYLDHVTAILYESTYQFDFGTLSSITTDFLVKNAHPIKKSSFPTLIFGPGGGGPPTEVYTSMLSDLASHGYTVIGLDHVYEQPFVRYPNGTGVIGLPTLYNLSVELIVPWIPARIIDTVALIDYLPTLSKKFGATINGTSIGVFGHSLGGASAAGALILDKRVKSAVNLDGAFFGNLGLNSSITDAKKPILLLGQEIHTGEIDGDESWGNFRNQQTGWWRQILVKGSFHLDFSDAAIWKTFSPFAKGSFGPIEGKRMDQISKTFLRAFFDFTLLGKEETIFNGPSAASDIIYYLGSDGTATG